MRRGWAKMKKWRGSKSMPPVEEDTSSNAGSRNLQSNSKQFSENPTFPPYKEPAPEALADQTFTLRQLEIATNNFSLENFIGEGGFGKVFKGYLAEAGQVVAIKQMDRHGQQGNREFFVEVLMLSMLHHPNLVNLIGYCADGDQRLLVYEYMSMGSLKDHLHDLHLGQEPLDWNTRMKIAIGAAKGLAYLHEKANPPVIYRDFKPSNILLDDDMNPKLSDFGFAKLAPVGENTHVSTRVMGTHGYCAPEYAMTGKLTLKSDVYSYGVVLLELITGRKAIDNSKPASERNLVAWARPLLKDRSRYPEMADPALNGRFPIRSLYQAVAIATLCLLEDSTSRPLISDVVTALSYMNNQASPNEGSTRQSRRSSVRITPSSTPSTSFTRTHVVTASPSYSPGARSSSSHSSSSYSSGQDRSSSTELGDERGASNSGNLRHRSGEERMGSGNLRHRNSEHSGHLRTFSMAEQSQYPSTAHIRTNSLHGHALDSLVTNL